MLALCFVLGTGVFFSQTTKPDSLKTVKKEIKKNATKIKKSDSATTAYGAKLKKDGTLDKRYKANKKLKKDGTPDKRYKENQ